MWDHVVLLVDGGGTTIAFKMVMFDQDEFWVV
jgi:hypothetical protein